MSILASPLDVVKREASRHAQEAVRRDRSEKQRAVHARLAEEMEAVARELVSLQAKVGQLEAESAMRASSAADPAADQEDAGADDDDDLGASSRAYALTPDDLEGLPPEVIAELNITAADKFESFVITKIKQAGGVLSLDKLIVACFKERNEVHKRILLNAKLYRMTRKKLLWSVPKKKGLYTTDPDIGQGIKPLDA